MSWSPKWVTPNQGNGAAEARRHTSPRRCHQRGLRRASQLISESLGRQAPAPSLEPSYLCLAGAGGWISVGGRQARVRLPCITKAAGPASRVRFPAAPLGWPGEGVLCHDRSDPSPRDRRQDASGAVARRGWCARPARWRSRPSEDGSEDWIDYRLEHHPEFLARVAAARGALQQGRGLRLPNVP